MELNDITGHIISAAMKVHTAMGPGLLESVYQTCLQHEIEKSGLNVHREVAIPVTYDGLKLDAKFRIDMLVEDLVIVELKCADALLPIHKAQILTYLRLADKPTGLLLNFKVVHMRQGINRILNNKHPYWATQNQNL
ncbi:MAG TPA: GxxExxY protein [Candidatus Angelobacter sp.]|nr:GxxExxY protein [Candidatus Angelobacter sp.]